MEILTDEQAKKFREFLPVIRRLANDLADVKSDLAGACDHRLSDRVCPVCELYLHAARGLTEVSQLLTKTLIHLENGPHPNAGLRTTNAVDEGLSPGDWPEEHDARR